jgi:hypothetical protein
VRCSCRLRALNRRAKVNFAVQRDLYDSRYDRWTPNRYVLGVEFPVGPHVVLEPYYLAQNNSRSNPPHINAFGFKLNLYL